MRPLSFRLLRACAPICSLLLLSACAGKEPASFERDERIDVTATIEAIDYEGRLVRLRTTDGRIETVQAGPAVRDLEQVSVGDRVDVSYYAALAVNVTKPGNDAASAHEAFAVRSGDGARPAGALGELLTTTVEIQAVDPSFNTVTFKRPDGVERIVGIDDPDTQSFIRKLKRGDLVQITYMEAIAVSVAPQG
jgi:hypothetical protein